MLKSVLLLIIAMVSIQFSASVAKKLFPIAGVAGTSSLRLLFASLILLIAYRPWRVKLSPQATKSLITYGASLGLMNLSFYFALQRIPLGIAVALEFTGPLAVAIFSSRKAIDFCWAITAGIGIYLLIPHETTQAALDPWGMFFALAAGFFWALYIIFGKRAGHEVDGSIAATVGMTVAMLFVLPFGLWFDHSKMFQQEVIGIGLVVGLVGSAIPYSLEMLALKKMQANTFGILMSLEPAIASLMGLVFLAEALTPLQWTAIACVMISSAGTTLTSQK